jgi:hypothetical protein
MNSTIWKKAVLLAPTECSNRFLGNQPAVKNAKPVHTPNPGAQFVPVVHRGVYPHRVLEYVKNAQRENMHKL